MKVVITLGPTHEPVDDVRYLANKSSGKMGAALAKEALRRGYDTTVIAGPVNIELPGGAKTLHVSSTAEMIEKSLQELAEGCDVFICAAAIADYSPVKSKGKMKSGPEELSLTLRKNPKLTKLVKEKFPGTKVVAFKAEHGPGSEGLIRAAREKLEKEDLDLIVANDIGRVGFGGDESEVYLVDRNDKVYIPRDSKTNIAGRILDEVAKRL